jgi:hypothetical protein
LITGWLVTIVTYSISTLFQRTLATNGDSSIFRHPTCSGKFGVENIVRRKGFVEIESCTMGIQHIISTTPNREPALEQEPWAKI